MRVIFVALCVVAAVSAADSVDYFSAESLTQKQSPITVQFTPQATHYEKYALEQQFPVKNLFVQTTMSNRRVGYSSSRSPRRILFPFRLICEKSFLHVNVFVLFRSVPRVHAQLMFQQVCLRVWRSNVCWQSFLLGVTATPQCALQVCWFDLCWLMDLFFFFRAQQKKNIALWFARPGKNSAVQPWSVTPFRERYVQRQEIASVCPRLLSALPGSVYLSHSWLIQRLISRCCYLSLFYILYDVMFYISF